MRLNSSKRGIPKRCSQQGRRPKVFEGYIKNKSVPELIHTNKVIIDKKYEEKSTLPKFVQNKKFRKDSKNSDLFSDRTSEIEESTNEIFHVRKIENTQKKMSRKLNTLRASLEDNNIRSKSVARMETKPIQKSLFDEIPIPQNSRLINVSFYINLDYCY